MYETKEGILEELLKSALHERALSWLINILSRFVRDFNGVSQVGNIEIDIDYERKVAAWRNKFIVQITDGADRIVWVRGDVDIWHADKIEITDAEMEEILFRGYTIPCVVDKLVAYFR